MANYQNPREKLVSQGGDSTASVPTGAGNTVIKSTQGRLCRAVVTAAGTGTGTVQFFDNATTNSGTMIGTIPATVSVGATFDFHMAALNGIVAANVVNGPVITVSFI